MNIFDETTVNNDIKSFIEQALTSNPDWIIVLDRKGGKFLDFLGAFPDEYLSKILYGRFLDFGSYNYYKSLFREKRVIVFDEMTQHGSNFKSIRSKLRKCGVEPILYCVARRRKYFDRFEVHVGDINTLYDLDDYEYNKFTRYLNRALSTTLEPLDVDHISAELTFRDNYETTIDFAKDIQKWGTVHFPHTNGLSSNRGKITLDNPSFYKHFNVDKSTGLSIINDGPCKMRFFIDTSLSHFQVVPIIYNSFDIEKNFSEITIDDKLYDLIWDAFGPLVHEDKCSTNELLYYEIVTLYENVRLLYQYFDEHKPATYKYTAMQKNLSRNYGYDTGDKLAKLISEYYEKTWIKEIHCDSHRLIEKNMVYVEESFDSVCRNIINLLLNDESSNIQHSRSYSSILQNMKNPYLASKALDNLLDNGYIKPENTIIREEGAGQLFPTVMCSRVYKASELSKALQRWDKNVIYSNEHEIRTSMLIPYVIDRMVEINGIRRERIGITLLNKMFTNLFHSWNDTGYEALFFNIRPYKYGPVVMIPGTFGPKKEEMNLRDFSNHSKTYLSKKYGSKQKMRLTEYFVANTDLRYGKEIKKYYSDDELDYLDGLVDIYSQIYQTSMNDKDISKFPIDDLITLGAIRSPEIGINHIHIEISLWVEELQQLANRASLKDYSKTGYDEEITNKLVEMQEFSYLVKDKIARFENIHSSLENIGNRLKSTSLVRFNLLNKEIESIRSNFKDMSSEYENVIADCHDFSEFMSCLTLFFSDIYSIFGLYNSHRTFSKNSTGRITDPSASYGKCEGYFDKYEISQGTLSNINHGHITNDKKEVYENINQLLPKIRSIVNSIIEQIPNEIDLDSITRKKANLIESSHKIGIDGPLFIGYAEVIQFKDMIKPNNISKNDEANLVFVDKHDKACQQLVKDLDNIMEKAKTTDETDRVYYAGDSWIIYGTDPVTTIEYAVKIQQGIFKLFGGDKMCIGLTYGNCAFSSGNIYPTVALIDAYSLVEKSNYAHRGMILIDSHFYDNLTNEFQEFFHQIDTSMKSKGGGSTTNVYMFLSKKYHKATKLQ